MSEQNKKTGKTKKETFPSLFFGNKIIKMRDIKINFNNIKRYQIYRKTLS